MTEYLTNVMAFYNIKGRGSACAPRCYYYIPAASAPSRAGGQHGYGVCRDDAPDASARKPVVARAESGACIYGWLTLTLLLVTSRGAFCLIYIFRSII